MTNIVQLPNNSADWSAIVAELCEIIDVKPMRYMAIEAAEWPVQREMLYDAAEIPPWRKGRPGPIYGPL